MDALLKRKDIDTSQIFLFGRSLGGCVAIELAANKLFRPFIRGIIVENTFTSISDMVDKVGGSEYPTSVCRWINS